jgi:glyoxylate/hydroxypyruvate reductase A
VAKPALLIATTGWDVESWARRIRVTLPDHPILCAERDGQYGGPEEALTAVHYVLAWKPRQDLLDRLPDLRVLFSLGAGVDHIFGLPHLPDVPIVRIVDRDLTARMTEYVTWQVLHHLRRGFDYAEQKAGRAWRDLPQPAARHVTVGLMGLGVMGSDAAEVLVRLGFNVRGWARTPKHLPGVEAFHGPKELDAFLSGTDILVALLPLTSETEGLINGALLSKLRRTGPLGGPVLINAGRGGSQVETDIIAALRDGTLKGASLDVFQTEPLPAHSLLWDVPNVTITPHVAAASDPEALAIQVGQQIMAFERGEPLRNVVDPARGY